jgi:transposase
VWVPDEGHEAVRDLVRARRQAKDDLTAAKLTLLSFLLRQDRRFPGRSTWSQAHWRWLGQQAFASPHPLCCRDAIWWLKLDGIGGLIPPDLGYLLCRSRPMPLAVIASPSSGTG